MGDFHQYYYGTKTAPYLTIFIGGNHEASNHLFELYYGGWVAPNIYYTGAANVLQLGPIKIAAMSGIWKGYDYQRQHYERLPYNQTEMYGIYHQRELDVRKLLAYRHQVDMGMSHDWPHEIWKHGDHRALFRKKGYFQEDAYKGHLGSQAATYVLERLRPAYWFSAHLHTKYAAVKDHNLHPDDGAHAQSQPNSRMSTRQPTQSVQILRRENKSTLEETTPSHNGDTQNDTSLSPAKSEAVSAWADFSKTVEASDNQAYEQEQAAREEEEARNGKQTVANYAFNETFKPVSIAQTDGAMSRKPQQAEKIVPSIPQLDGSCFSSPKRRRKSSPSDETQGSTQPRNFVDTESAPAQGAVVTNPDAIDIDMSDSEDDDSQTPMLNQDKAPDTTASLATSAAAHAESDHTTNSATYSLEAETHSSKEAEVNNNQSTPVAQREAVQDSEVSEDVRQQLADMSATFAPTQRIKKSADLPFPEETITNKTTQFLALSKVEAGHDRDFLQLLEIHSISSEVHSELIARPLKLNYDPEWLAILRAFADELEVGGSENDRVPEHQGDTSYRERIAQEEQWIQEHVVAKDLLAVPDNFQITVQPQKEAPEAQTEMPRETTSPQTASFCKLLGIENKFDFSEEDRDARIAAGPAPERDLSARRGGFQHRGGRGGNRGGGRGNSRGRGGRGRGGGRGRR